MHLQIDLVQRIRPSFVGSRDAFERDLSPEAGRGRTGWIGSGRGGLRWGIQNIKDAFTGRPGRLGHLVQLMQDIQRGVEHSEKE